MGTTNMAKSAIFNFETGETTYIDMPPEQEAFEQSQREIAIARSSEEYDREAKKSEAKEALKAMVSEIQNNDVPKNTEDLKTRLVSIENTLAKILTYLDIDFSKDN